MTPPVGAVQHRAGLDDAAGQVADDIDARRTDRHAAERRFQGFEGRLHQGAVEGAGRVQAPEPHSLGLQPLGDGLDGLDRTADHLVEPVVRRNADSHALALRVQRLHRGRHACRGREDRRHRTALGARQRSAACLREMHTVLEAEHSRRLSRRQLAGTVSHHHRGPDAHAGPQRGERALERVERRLLPGRVAQLPGGGAATEHHVQQGGAPSFPEHRLAAIQNRAGHRLPLVQLPSHAHPLASLSGVGERDPGRAAPRHCALGRIRDLFQPPAQGVGVAERDALAVVEVAPPDARRPCHVGQQRLRRGTGRRCLPDRFVEPRQIAAGEIPERRLRLPGERQHAGRAATRFLLRR